MYSRYRWCTAGQSATQANLYFSLACDLYLLPNSQGFDRYTYPVVTQACHFNSLRFSSIHFVNSLILACRPGAAWPVREQVFHLRGRNTGGR
eukprot:scaffold452493_cov24-Prasinocladus_malaysianus.AAC.1